MLHCETSSKQSRVQNQPMRKRFALFAKTVPKYIRGERNINGKLTPIRCNLHNLTCHAIYIKSPCASVSHLICKTPQPTRSLLHAIVPHVRQSADTAAAAASTAACCWCRLHASIRSQVHKNTTTTTRMTMENAENTPALCLLPYLSYANAIYV